MEEAYFWLSKIVMGVWFAKFFLGHCCFLQLGEEWIHAFPKGNNVKYISTISVENWIIFTTSVFHTHDPYLALTVGLKIRRLQKGKTTQLKNKNKKKINK